MILALGFVVDHLLIPRVGETYLMCFPLTLFHTRGTEPTAPESTNTECRDKITGDVKLQNLGKPLKKGLSYGDLP